ncbi:hypothetical protein MFIFM68171_05587 [Madurella fahalii]|uniref:SnoaL-like domain-containing protein n=1 Tax=Madurella fahalii TaxID=1157608 RepID=A0ABQ0GC89_9PEZI
METDNMDDLSATRLHTVYTLLEGYSSLSASQLLEHLSPDFFHFVLPSRLGMPALDKDSFALHAAGIFAIFDEFRMVPKAMYEDEKRSVAIIHARMEGTLKDRRRGKEWNNECVMIVRLSRDGKQVLQIQEFVDSAKAVEMRETYAPEHFTTAKKRSRGWVYKAFLFACLAAGSFYVAKRVLQQHD